MSDQISTCTTVLPPEDVVQSTTSSVARRCAGSGSRRDPAELGGYLDCTERGEDPESSPPASLAPPARQGVITTMRRSLPVALLAVLALPAAATAAPVKI